jgi:hypothetical protein
MTWATRPTRFLELGTFGVPELVSLVAVAFFARVRGLLSAAVAMFVFLAFSVR